MDSRSALESGKRFASSRRSGLLVVFAAIGLALLVGGCYTPTYPADIFPEMHYAPFNRRGEPPRALGAAEAVPVTGSDVPAGYFEDPSKLQSPLPRNDQNLAAGDALYKVNCIMCHGADGKGTGIIAAYFKAANQTPPVDYTNADMMGSTDGEMYASITGGKGNMPSFRYLLTDKQRWQLVQRIRAFQGK